MVVALVWIAVLGLMGLAFGGFGAWIRREKGGDPRTGAIVGFLFGPLGVLILALLPAAPAPPRRARVEGRGGRSRSRSTTPGEMPADWRPRVAEPEPAGEGEDERILRYLDGTG